MSSCFLSFIPDYMYYYILKITTYRYVTYYVEVYLWLTKNKTYYYWKYHQIKPSIIFLFANLNSSPNNYNVWQHIFSISILRYLILYGYTCLTWLTNYKRSNIYWFLPCGKTSSLKIHKKLIIGILYYYFLSIGHYMS